MNVTGDKSRLVGLTRDIMVHWSETKNHWRDAKSDEFERRFMAELTAHVNRATIIMDKLDELLKKVRSDCE